LPCSKQTKTRMSDECKVVGLVFAVIITIISVIMLACSFDTLSPHEMGLAYNAPLLHLSPKTYHNGRHFLALGHYFIKYPSNWVYMEFSSQANAAYDEVGVWTRDRQEITIEFGFYYQLDPEHLIDLHYKYGKKYVSVIKDISLNAVRDITTLYETADFFTDRNIINLAMHAEIAERLGETLWARVPDFNFLRVSVPPSFAAAVLNKVITVQLKSTLEFTQVEQTVRANTNVLVATYEQFVTTQLALFQANATITTQKAAADAFYSVTVAKAGLVKDLASKLSFVNPPAPITGLVATNTTALLKFLYVDLLQSLAADPQTDLAVDFNSGLFSFGK